MRQCIVQLMEECFTNLDNQKTVEFNFGDIQIWTENLANFTSHNASGNGENQRTLK